MRIIDIDAPPREPVTLEMAKQFLRVTQPDEDSLISDLILAARIRVETCDIQFGRGNRHRTRPHRYKFTGHATGIALNVAAKLDSERAASLWRRDRI